MFNNSSSRYIGGVEYDSETNTQLTTSVATPWADNSVTFKIALRMNSFGFGMQPFTVSAKVTFGDESSEELTTEDAKIYKRGKSELRKSSELPADVITVGL